MGQLKAGIVIHRPNTTISYANPSALHILGVSETELRGTIASERDWHFIYPNGEVMAVRDYPVNLVLARQAPIKDLEAGIVSNDKSYPTWVRVAGFPEFDRAGRLTQVVISFIDITQQILLQELALRDDLTNLVSRNLFYDRLKKALRENLRTERKIAVFFVDVDAFKRINDMHGHDIGDVILVEVANRLRRVMRPGDTVGRQGGDEFLVLVPAITQISDIFSIAEKMVCSFTQPIKTPVTLLSISVSIGIAIDTNGCNNAEEIVRHADLAMYRAKSRSKNRYEIFSDEMEFELQRSIDLECGLRSALDKSEIIMHYQPKFNLKTRRLDGFEALMRWKRQDGQVIYPDEFIPIAERSGLIVALVEFVIHQVCKDINKFLRAGILNEGARLSFNVSEKQFNTVGLVNHVEHCLKKYQVGASYLELEITETVLMQSTQRSAAILQRLQALGVTTAIDDFGTGYSSLSYLKHLPVCVLKIDKEFIMDIPHDTNDMAIASAIVVMAHKLGLHVIAEGAETEDQINFLTEIGCESVQGFFFSQAMSVKRMHNEFAPKQKPLEDIDTD